MYEEYMDHFAPGISKAIEIYARERVFLKSRYIFTRREGNKQYGYCTHCHTDLQTKLKHNELVKCPKCKSLCVVKSSGMGRNYMYDDAYFLYFEKSRKDPKVIVARGIMAARDYRGDYYYVKTKYLETARYVFEMGNSAMFTRQSYFNAAGSITEFNWEKRRTIFSMFEQNHIANKRYHDVCLASVHQAIKGTPFQYSTYEQYPKVSPERFLGLYAKAPCVEYLTKLGFRNLVKDKIWGNCTWGAINWRGKSLDKVLRLTGADLKAIKQSGVEVDGLFLHLLQISKRDGSNLTFEEIKDIENDGYWEKNLLGLLNNLTLRSASTYINKQYERQIKPGSILLPLKSNVPKHYYNKSQLAHAWRDYISDCRTLNLDLNKKSVMFPRDLYRAHQNTIKQIKTKADKELDEKIKAMVKDLDQRYRFTRSGLIIRPAASTQELINEGKALNHCVGTYARGYVDKSYVILVIRKRSEPDVPFFTVQVRGHQVTQVYGRNNCLPDKKVAAFVEAFKKAKLEISKPKVRIQIPA